MKITVLNHHFRLVLCLHLFILVCAGSLSAQNYSYTHYDERNGLPSSIIYDITQDRDGFIWFASENGLTRFDGARFKTYTTREGLPDNAVLGVHASPSGKIYFNAFTHPPCYLKGDSVHRLLIPKEEEFNMTSPGVYLANGPRVLYNFEGRIYVIQPNDSVIYLPHLYKDIPSVKWVSTDDTSLIVGSPDHIFYIHNTKGIIKKTQESHYLKPGFHRGYGYVELNPTFPDSVFAPKGKLNNDLYYYIDGNDVLFFSQLSRQLVGRIHIEKASRAFIDSESNVWIATTGNGVYRIPSFEFRHLKLPQPSADLYSFAMYKNQLLGGSSFSKLYTLEKKDSVSIASIGNYTSYIERSYNPVSRTMNTNRIVRILCKADTCYLAADAFLLKKTGAKILFSPVFPCKDLDTTGRKLLVCTGGAVMLLNAADLSIEDTLLRQRATTGVYYQGDYYIGTVGGVVKINAATKALTWLKSTHTSLQNRIVSIRRGFDNDLWIATSGSGLVHFKQGKVIAQYNATSGLSSDICTSLFVDTSAVWIGTNTGLNRLRLQGNSANIMLFSTANGLTTNVITALLIHGDTVYAGSNTGLTYFNKNTDGNESICRLHITGVSQGNLVLPVDTSYTFPHSALNIKIDFTAISFKSAGNNIYYYRLKGLDTGWNSTTNNFVNFSTLPAGNYKLMIRAVNKFGVESETRIIHIRITPPWWQTWWFITIAAFSFVIVMFLLYRRNINALKKKEKLKRANEAKFAALEQQALQAQMNPHFIFNCLNSIQSFILDFDAEGANQYLTAFASMIRQTLDISSHPLITVADETRYLDTYLQLEKLRFREKFNYRIQVDEEIDTFNTWIPGMLLQPFVENSLRHGIQHRSDNNGTILVEIKPFEETAIVCTIRDNGVGRKRAEEIKSTRHIEYQSKGTSISNRRVKTINNQFNTKIHITTGDIVDESGGIGGTLVTIIIPELRKP